MEITQTAEIEHQLKSIQQLIQTANFSKAIEQAHHTLQTVTDPKHTVELLYLQAVGQRYNKSFNEAISSIGRLLDINANHSRAHQEYGYNYLAINEPNQAQKAFEQAVKLNPSLVSSWQELIEIYRQQQDSDKVQQVANHLSRLKQLPPALLAVTELIQEKKFLKAEQICRQFLQNNKQHIQGMCLLAEIGIELKIYDDAEFLLASALALKPSDIPARALYLNLLIRLGKFKAASTQVNNLLQVQPDNLSFKVAKATVLAGLGEIEQAISIFNQVIKIDGQVAEFHLQLGHALKAHGDINAAIAAYQQAYQINPQYGDAFWSLANTKTYGFSDNEIAHMQQQQTNPHLALTDKIQLLFATGKAFEDRKDYQQAFACYEQGNKLQNEANRFDISTFEQQVQAQISQCSEELFKLRGELGHDAPDPIFIVGLPRAGSTLLEQILASHSQIDGTMELHNILGLASRLKGRNPKESQYPQNLSSIDSKYFSRFGQQYINETQVYRQSAPFFIDKMPNNFLHVGLIRLILPNAKIIDARRSPMACCFSGFKQLFAEGQEFSYNLEDLGRYYKAYLTMMDHWHKVLPGYVLTIHHEDVVNDLESEVRKILDFCGLEFEQSCVDFHKTKRNIKTPSSEQVRQPIYKSATEQWQHFEPYLGPLKKALNH